MEITEKTIKFLTRLKASMRESEEPALYEGGNLPYHAMGDDASYAETYEYAKNKYGELGELCFFLARMDSQVNNGGFSQWYDNGYLSSGKGGVFRNRKNEEFDILERFIELFNESDLKNLPNGNIVASLLTALEDELYALNEECYHCHNKRYVKCDACHGTGKVDGGEEECDACLGEGTTEDGEECLNCHGTGMVDTNEEDCDECEGEGQMPCEDCNEDGQLEENATEGELNTGALNRMDTQYYSINDSFVEAVNNYLINLMNEHAESGFLATASSYKESKKRVRESTEDKKEKLLKLLNVPFVKEAITKNGESFDEIVDKAINADPDYSFATTIELLESKAKDELTNFVKKLVPSSGSCDTLGGELYRAAMKLEYRYYNDGDGPANTSTYEAFNFLFKKVRIVNEIFIREFNEDFHANIYGEYSFIEFFKYYGHCRIISSSMDKDYKNDLRDIIGDITLIAFVLETLGINPSNSEDMLDCSDGPLVAPTDEDYTFNNNYESFIE